MIPAHVWTVLYIAAILPYVTSFQGIDIYISRTCQYNLGDPEDFKGVLWFAE